MIWSPCNAIDDGGWFQDGDAWEGHTFDVRGHAGRRLVQVAVAARSISSAPDVSVHVGSLLVQELGASAMATVSNLRARGPVTRQQHDDKMDAVSLLLEWDCTGAGAVPV